MLINALIHRDYFVSASIRLMIFSDRVEHISPGHLPDTLDTQKIRYGLSNRRNPTLTSHAIQLLPYRGLGTGVPRALQVWPQLELVDDQLSNQFKAVVRRSALEQLELAPQPESILLGARVLQLLQIGPMGKRETSFCPGAERRFWSAQQNHTQPFSPGLD